MPLGIPHSRFLGGVDEWTVEDRAKVLAFREWDTENCPSCGTRHEDWIDDATGRVADPPPFAVKPRPCQGCGELHMNRSQHDYNSELAKSKGETPRFGPYDPEDNALDALG